MELDRELYFLRVLSLGFAKRGEFYVTNQVLAGVDPSSKNLLPFKYGVVVVYVNVPFVYEDIFKVVRVIAFPLVIREFLRCGERKIFDIVSRVVLKEVLGEGAFVPDEPHLTPGIATRVGDNCERVDNVRNRLGFLAVETVYYGRRKSVKGVVVYDCLSLSPQLQIDVVVLSDHVRVPHNLFPGNPFGSEELYPNLVGKEKGFFELDIPPKQIYAYLAVRKVRLKNLLHNLPLPHSLVFYMRESHPVFVRYFRPHLLRNPIEGGAGYFVTHK